MVYNGSWGAPAGNISNTNRNNNIVVSDNELLITNDYSISKYDASLTRNRYIDGGFIPNGNLKYALKDNTGLVWAIRNNRIIRSF